MIKKWPYLAVIIGAFLWGLIGLFVQGLYDVGFSALQVVTIRVTTAAIILLFYTSAVNPSLLRISYKDFGYFIGTGLLSIVFFNWCFFTAIQETSLSVAVILLYTGPVFVTIISRFVFKELFTRLKIAALLLALLGCGFVIGLFPSLHQTISFYGMIVGLGAGFGYALYSIFGKLALKMHHPLTIATYTFVFASVTMLPFSGLWSHFPQLLNLKAISFGLGLGLFPTVIAFILYTNGLKYIESSKASITTTIEPVVATLIGIFLLDDRLTGWQLLGILLVLFSVITIQLRPMKNRIGTKSERRAL